MSSTTKLSNGKNKSPTAKFNQKGERSSTSHSNYLTVQESASWTKDEGKPLKRSASKNKTNSLANGRSPGRVNTNKQFTPVLNVNMDKMVNDKQAKLKESSSPKSTKHTRVNTTGNPNSVLQTIQNQ